MALQEGSFMDGEGRVWTPRVDVEALARLERDLGFGVLAACADPDRLRAEVLDRVDVVARLFWLGVRDQARARGLDETQVRALLSRDGNFPHAARAVARSLADFFRPPVPPGSAATGSGDGRRSTPWRRWRAWFRAGGPFASLPGA